MSKLPLTFACGLYDRMVPLYTGEVQPDGIDLNFIVDRQPARDFRPHGRRAGIRRLGNVELRDDSSAIAPATARSSRCRSFPRASSATATSSINRKSGIKTPKDLEGKRVGVPLYTQTAAIFIRGMLQHEYGVDLLEDPLGAGRAQPRRARTAARRVLPLLKPVDIETEPHRQVAERSARARARSTPSPPPTCPSRYRTQSRHRAAVPEFPRGRARLLPAHQDFPDHASGRDAPRHLREASLRRHQPLQRVRRVEEPRRSRR